MISEMFQELDAAVETTNEKKDAYDKLEKETSQAYQDYLNAFKVADGIKAKLQIQLGNLLPTTVPERVRVV